MKTYDGVEVQLHALYQQLHALVAFPDESGPGTQWIRSWVGPVTEGVSKWK